MTALLPFAPAHGPVHAAEQPPHTTQPVHEARTLTRGGNLAQIALDGQIYTLRITRQGKLILTK